MLVVMFSLIVETRNRVRTIDEKIFGFISCVDVQHDDVCTEFTR